MTYKKIIYPAHAAWRRSMREFTRRDVRDLLATGERTKAPTYRGDQRWQVSGEVRGREAHVIFIETAHEIIIVTVEWKGDTSEEA